MRISPDWFVKQGEEETNATDLIKKMDLLALIQKSLYILDNELAARFIPLRLLYLKL